MVGKWVWVFNLEALKFLMHFREPENLVHFILFLHILIFFLFLIYFALCRFPGLLDPSPFCMWALVVSLSLSWTKLLVSQDSTLFWLGPRSLSSSRVRSLGFLESSLLHCMTYIGLQSLIKVLDELIPEVFLSTSKPCINTKLQKRHAWMNLLYQGG
jgi:hypothetical protein